MKEEEAVRGDFSQGKVWKNVIAQALPLMLAQLVQLLYNVVDRIFIGHIEGTGAMALTGVGLVFPLTTLVAAFTALYSMGGTPLFSIARGEKQDEHARKIMNQAAAALIATSFVIFAVCWIFRKPILYLLGAGDLSYPYADAYLKIYLFGTTFTMFSTGMNGFINAQGYPKVGMMSTLAGAVLNFILDPLLIFGFGLGISGAAIATVISQAVSFIWVCVFLAGRKNIYRISLKLMIPDFKIYREMLPLGFTGFVMQATNCLTQAVGSATLSSYGGELYVGINACLLSIRELAFVPAVNLANGAQPVFGYNYGAGKYNRLKQAIRFTGFVAFLYSLIVWIFIMLFPEAIMSAFTTDPDMVAYGAPALRLYLSMFVFQSFQGIGQSTFTALECPKRALFFSLLRKVFLVLPVMLIFPKIGFGVNGIFISEPISNVIGGLACFITMYLTLYKKLPDEPKAS